jgi:hypothetical protein
MYVTTLGIGIVKKTSNVIMAGAVDIDKGRA